MTQYDKILAEIAQQYVSQTALDCKKIKVKVAPVLNKIKTIQTTLAKTAESDIKTIRTILTQLVGLNYHIEHLEKNIQAFRHSKRVAFRFERKKEYDKGLVVDDEGKPVKYTDKGIDAEADLYIAIERDLYYDLSGCVSGVAKSITACQSLIKEYERNQKKLKAEEMV